MEIKLKKLINFENMENTPANEEPINEPVIDPTTSVEPATEDNQTVTEEHTEKTTSKPIEEGIKETERITVITPGIEEVITVGKDNEPSTSVSLTEPTTEHTIPTEAIKSTKKSNNDWIWYIVGVVLLIGAGIAYSIITRKQKQNEETESIN